MFNPEEQNYIGDGVYATVENGMIKLTANSPVTDTIYLEPLVYEALVKFVKQTEEHYKSIETKHAEGN